MGWWAIGDEGGGIDWRSLSSGGIANRWPGEDDSNKLMMGDGPADQMGVVLDILGQTSSMNEIKSVMKKAFKNVVREYKEDWGRRPHKKELIACFNFCQVPKIFRPIWDELIKELETK